MLRNPLATALTITTLLTQTACTSGGGGSPGEPGSGQKPPVLSGDHGNNGPYRPYEQISENECDNPGFFNFEFYVTMNQLGCIKWALMRMEPSERQVQAQRYFTSTIEEHSSGFKRNEILSSLDIFLHHGAKLNGDGANLPPMLVALSKTKPNEETWIADFLLNYKGIDVESASSGVRPLTYAASSGHLAFAGKLLDHGANIDGVNSKGQTALNLAVLQDREEIALWLISKGANVNASEVLIDAAKVGNEKIFFNLLERGAKAPKTEKSRGLVRLAAIHGKIRILKYAIEQGFNIEDTDSDGETALVEAITRNFDELTDYLLLSGANINVKSSDDKSLLEMALSRKKSKLAETLLAKGADAKAEISNGRNLLYYTVLADDLDSTQRLIRAGADVRKIDSFNRNLVFYVRSGKMLNFLKAHDLDLNLKDVKNSTMLTYLTLGTEAALSESVRVDLITLFAKYGAKLNIVVARSWEDWGYLDVAVNSNSIMITNAFLKNGLNANFRVSEISYPPLFRANSVEMVEFLLNNGANINAVCIGKTYLDETNSKIERDPTNTTLQNIKTFLVSRGALTRGEAVKVDRNNLLCGVTK